MSNKEIIILTAVIAATGIMIWWLNRKGARQGYSSSGAVGVSDLCSAFIGKIPTTVPNDYVHNIYTACEKFQKRCGVPATVTILADEMTQKPSWGMPPTDPGRAAMDSIIANLSVPTSQGGCDVY